MVSPRVLLTVALVLPAAVFVLAPHVTFGSCSGSAALMHDPQRGGFIFEELAGRGYGPRIRFWALDGFAYANSAFAAQYEPGMEWLTQYLDDYPDDTFFLFQANWFDRNVFGCFDGVSDRTVVEVSYLVHEGRRDHYASYLIASVVWDMRFDFSSVVNGNGRRSSDVMAVPVPPPVLRSHATLLSDPAYMSFTLYLPPPASFGDAGAPDDLARGYLLYYVNDVEPTTSDPAAYAAVRREGAEPCRPGQMSLTRTVPLSDPSLFQSSLPLVPSSAEKNSQSPTRARFRGIEPMFPNVPMSFTVEVPGRVPSLLQISRPSDPLSAAK